MELYVQKLIWGIQALTVTLCLEWENGGHQIISRRPEGNKSIGAKRYFGKKCGATSKSEVKVKITAGQSFYFLTLDFYCRNAFEVEELLLISWRL